ncbi:hypothetical protein A2U01_0102705, partial [Trifolium medium]|nr:hypothetical protein [Trifolium medium]
VLVQQFHDDWVLNSDEAKKAESDSVNQQSSSIPVDTEKVASKVVPNDTNVVIKTENPKGHNEAQ